MCQNEIHDTNHFGLQLKGLNCFCSKLQFYNISTKIKTLIEYLNAKRELIDVIAKKQKPQDKEKIQK